MISASPHLYRSGAKNKGVSQEIVDRALAQAVKPEEKGLPSILSLKHLAHRSGIDYEYLRGLTTRSHDGYKPFFIRKRNGGQRLIAAPEPKLAALQRWIADEILLKRPVHPASFAYSRGGSPIKCARHHLGARWLVKIDIHDFFESIDERRIYFAFRSCGYQPLVAFELARITTRISTGKSVKDKKWHVDRRKFPPGIAAYRRDIMGHLPQGAPTSPVLSNLASQELDAALQKLAARYKLTYTRYSDDLIFSTSADLGHTAAGHLVGEVERVLAAFGHILHRKKTAISPPGARKIVLGLLVDGSELKLTREFRNRIADHIRGIEKFGLATHAAHRHFTTLWGMVRHLGGLLAYAKAVDAKFAAALQARLRKALKEQSWPSTNSAK